MKCGYVEKRYLISYDLRRACILYGWYTSGTSEDYSRLLDSVTGKVITTDDIFEIATNIVEHSDNLTVEDLGSVMYLVGSLCSTLFEKV